MGAKIAVSGDWHDTMAYLNKLKSGELFAALEKFGPAGVSALSSATPVDSAQTAQSWTYEVVNRPGYFAIHWSNTHDNDGENVAILLQYGHGTGTGGYVQGRDYIMPAIRPIFDQIDAEVQRVVRG